MLWLVDLWLVSLKEVNLRTQNYLRPSHVQLAPSEGLCLYNLNASCLEYITLLDWNYGVIKLTQTCITIRKHRELLPLD